MKDPTTINSGGFRCSNFSNEKSAMCNKKEIRGASSQFASEQEAAIDIVPGLSASVIPVKKKSKGF
jgi:hypothetical protein